MPLMDGEDWMETDNGEEVFTVVVVPKGYHLDRYSYLSDARLAGGGVVKDAGGVMRVVARKD